MYRKIKGLAKSALWLIGLLIFFGWFLFIRELVLATAAEMGVERVPIYLEIFIASIPILIMAGLYAFFGGGSSEHAPPDRSR